MYIRSGRFHKAKFVDRPNRWVGMVDFEGKKIPCHLPNPGRMRGFLFPGAEVYIEFHNNPERKTSASIIAVMAGELIQLESNIVFHWLPTEFGKSAIGKLDHFKILKQEFKIGKHRFDYLLEDGQGKEIICEVKSTSRVDNEVACFPDGVSDRATNHLKKLIELSKGGHKTLILFLVYQDANYFWPCSQVDKNFTIAFERAVVTENLEIKVIRAKSELIAKNAEHVGIKMELTNEIHLKPHQKRGLLSQ